MPNTGPTNNHKHVGIELEVVSKYDTHVIAGHLTLAGVYKYCDIGHDMSIMLEEDYPYEMEIRVCGPQQLIYSIVRRVCKALEGLCKVNSSCGLHVHLDMRKRNVRAAFKRLVDNQAKLNRLVSPSRINHRYCISNTTDTFDTYMNNRGRDLRGYEYSKYLAINPYSYSRLKTIEVRLHEGCLESDKINKWIKLLVSIADNKPLR